MQIWHNNRCGKSREAKTILENSGLEFETFEYLKNKFTKEDIKNIISKLGITDVRDMLRKKEKEYKELNIADESKTQEQIIELIIENPKLIERPIIIKDDKAVIARPMENLVNFLG